MGNNKIKHSNHLGIWKLYALMICCVITAGLVSATTSHVTKAIANKYFESEENPARNFLTPPLRESLGVSPSGEIIPSAERENAIRVATKKIDHIKTVGFTIDAIGQLFSIFLYAFFITRHINKRDQK